MSRCRGQWRNTQLTTGDAKYKNLSTNIAAVVCESIDIAHHVGKDGAASGDEPEVAT